MEKKSPKYLELVDIIKEKINTGIYAPGTKIPSEHTLVRDYEISRQTVRRAMAALEQEGYIKSIRGSGTYVLETKATEGRNRIALMTTFVDSYIFPCLIRNMEKQLAEYNYAMQVAFTNNQVEREREILQSLLHQEDLAGMICETTKGGLPNPNLDMYRQLQNQGVAIIFVNCQYKELDAPFVSLDDKKAAKTMVSHMIEKGHRRIGGIFKLDDIQGHNRYSGYLEALLEAGVELVDSRVVWYDTNDLENLHLSRERILRSIRGCTAFMCYNDEVAYELVDMLTEEGIRIPEDLSIGGIDDSELAVMSKVPITSVHNPIEKLGICAADNLVRMIQNPEYDGNYQFEGELVIRGSIKNLKA